MPFVPIPKRTDAERARIRLVIPIGWLRRQLRHLYDVEMRQAGADPIWGICGHDHVCVLAGIWRHPYPASPVCDDHPTRTYSGIY